MGRVRSSEVLEVVEEGGSGEVVHESVGGGGPYSREAKREEQNSMHFGTSAINK